MLENPRYATVAMPAPRKRGLMPLAERPPAA
jgi:hypothetical protein